MRDSVTTGTGTVDGQAGSTIATNANVIATVGSWVVGPGPDSVRAIGTFADTSVHFAAALSGTDFPQTVSVVPANGVAYDATGGDVVPYGASYLYLDGPQGHAAGFEATDFSHAN